MHVNSTEKKKYKITQVLNRGGSGLCRLRQYQNLKHIVNPRINSSFYSSRGQTYFLSKTNYKYYKSI